MIKYSLLFLTQNRLGVTARCFRSMAPTLCRPDVEWRIVDNGSTDGTAEWLLRMAARYPGQVHVTLRADNTGVAGGRQILLDQALGDILIILDSDVEARNENWLEDLVKPLEQPEVGICGPGGHWLMPQWVWYEPVEAGYVGEVDCVSGYCQALKRSAIPGFQFDMFFNPYWIEDTYMCLWIREHGNIVWCTGDIGLYHIYAGSGDDGRGQEKQRYLASLFRGKGLVKFERDAGIAEVGAYATAAH